MNIFIISGRLAAAPKLTTSTTAPRASFTVAVDRPVTDSSADFFYATAFGRTAENLARHCVKGQTIEVQGHLTVSSWEQDGERRSRVALIADRIQFGAKPRTTTPNGADVPGDTEHGDLTDDSEPVSDEDRDFATAEFGNGVSR